MAKFEIVLTTGNTDWLETVEAASQRDAINKVLSAHRSWRTIEVKTCTKVPTKPKRETEMPAHVAAALDRLREGE